MVADRLSLSLASRSLVGDCIRQLSTSSLLEVAAQSAVATSLAKKPFDGICWFVAERIE